MTILLHDGSHLIRDFNDVIVLIKIGVLFPKIDLGHK